MFISEEKKVKDAQNKNTIEYLLSVIFTKTEVMLC